ncbi:MAG: AAA family ATPase [Euryarchaeota archaeon]
MSGYYRRDPDELREEGSGGLSLSGPRNPVPDAKLVELKPLGYPIREPGMGKEVVVDSYEAFNAYAREQWLGEIVREGMILFDTGVVHSYAFKVVRVVPSGTGRVTASTKFVLRLRSEEDRMEVPKLTLDDVVGHAEVKRACRLLVEYLRNPEELSEWAPRTVLFHGPTGTGKTRTAKAVAGEAKVPLLRINAAELLGKYVGEASERIRRAFKRARESAPCVLFVDEIDALGLDRRYQELRGDVVESVNSLLTNLDRLKERSEGVLFIAATNHPDLLDPALKNRFEYELEFRPPDREEREELVRYYAKRLPLPLKVDPAYIAARTSGMSHREIKERVLKRALLEALRDGADAIEKEHVRRALREGGGGRRGRQVYHG